MYRGGAIGGGGSVIGGGGGLVVTGSPVGMWAVVGVILLVTGLFMARAARQRRAG